jgi:hypothetical protein
LLSTRKIFSIEPSNTDDLCETILPGLAMDPDFAQYVSRAAGMLYKEIELEGKVPSVLATELFRQILSTRKQPGKKHGPSRPVVTLKKQPPLKTVVCTLILAFVFLLAMYPSSSELSIPEQLKRARVTNTPAGYRDLRDILPPDHEVAPRLSHLSGECRVTDRTSWLAASRKCHPDQHQQHKEVFTRVQTRINDARGTPSPRV